MNQLRTLRRKMRVETQIAAAPGFPQMGQVHYLPFMQKLHAELKPKVYFEIGTESGASLSFAKCASIAVDPRFQLQSDVSRNKPELHLYQGTSDDFFATRLIERLGLQIDLAFLDGMHLFEFLLRDFMNTERAMRRGGTILMHDCVPFNYAVAEREWDRTKTQSWTGDVWKLIPILREWRPDLEITVLDAAPSGLVAVRDVDPDSTVLRESYKEIVARYRDADLDSFGLDRLRTEIRLTPSRRFLRRIRSAPEAAKHRFRIKIAAPVAEAGEFWGEHAFGDGLAAAMRRAGHEARVDTIRDWNKNRSPDEIDIVIRGHNFRRCVYTPLPGASAFLWLIYTPWPDLSDEELAAYAHVAVASEPYLDHLADRIPGDKLSLLPQAFDADRMAPTQNAERDEVVYVANNPGRRGEVRRMAQHIEALAADVAVWGKRWEGTPLGSLVRADHIGNEDLPRVYANAAAVLNDHVGEMGVHGFPSNRIFDALACATPVISDPVAWLPDDLRDFVEIVSTPDEFRAAIERIRSESATKRKARRDLAKQMRATHSFDARADRILETVRALYG